MVLTSSAPARPLPPDEPCTRCLATRERAGQVQGDDGPQPPHEVVVGHRHQRRDLEDVPGDGDADHLGREQADPFAGVVGGHGGQDRRDLVDEHVPQGAGRSGVARGCAQQAEERLSGRQTEMKTEGGCRRAGRVGPREVGERRSTAAAAANRPSLLPK